MVRELNAPAPRALFSSSRGSSASECRLGRFEYRMDEWNKHELIEFFGVLPEEDEDNTYLSFAVEKDGLRLNATFFQHFFDVYLSIFREGIKEPAFTTEIEASPGVR